MVSPVVKVIFWVAYAVYTVIFDQPAEQPPVMCKVDIKFGLFLLYTTKTIIISKNFDLKIDCSDLSVKQFDSIIRFSSFKICHSSINFIGYNRILLFML